jgi:hypothetical protein
MNVRFNGLRLSLPNVTSPPGRACRQLSLVLSTKLFILVLLPTNWEKGAKGFRVQGFKCLFPAVSEFMSLWLLRGEVISLYKKKIDACDICSNIILVDRDDFEFETIADRHLTGDSKYAKRTGLNVFSQGGLVPKICMKGALLFLLPDDNEAEYFLSVEGGKIQEI